MNGEGARRIFGIETEYGLTCTPSGHRPLTPEELARHLFKPVVEWGKSSNVFLPNGGRIYLDVGSHPEYATAECDNIDDLLLQDRAGDEMVLNMALRAQESLREEGVETSVFLLKNNTDSVGNSYGCHENYLIRRRSDYISHVEALLPFLVTRQIIVGAGKVLTSSTGTRYVFSQRADYMWDGVSSSTTRSRPMINTRDEPHADADLYRRLHVIAGDSNMAEPTTRLKILSMNCMLRLLELGKLRRDRNLDNPVKAVRQISHDLSGRALVALSSGSTVTALALQFEYLAQAHQLFQAGDMPNTADYEASLNLWERTLHAIEQQEYSQIDTEIDWAIKHRVICAYQNRHSVPLDSDEVAQIDLRYHDIHNERGIMRMMEKAGQIVRLTNAPDVHRAQQYPPQTTRARLRGEFIRIAKERKRDVTVDWLHLKINDLGSRSVMCKDPFLANDPRVDALIAML